MQMDQSYLRIRLKSCYRFQPYSMTEAKNVRTPMRIYVRKKYLFLQTKEEGKSTNCWRIQARREFGP